MSLPDSNPGSWREAKIAQYELFAVDHEQTIAALENLEAGYDAEGDERRLRETREYIGSAREALSFYRDRARTLRAQADDLEQPLLSMAVTRRVR